MKSIASITCVCTAFLLSSCVLNPQEPARQADTAAYQASQDLANALRTEEKTLLEEARNAEAQATASATERAMLEARRKALTEELARQEAEARVAAAQQAAREAQARVEAAEKARMEAEARMRQAEEVARIAQEQARERAMAEAAEKAAREAEEADGQPRRAQLFSSRGRRKAPAAVSPEAPTEKQQAAALKMLARQAEKKGAEPRTAKAPAPPQEKATIAHTPAPRKAPKAAPQPAPEPRLAAAPALTSARHALRGRDFTLTEIDDDQEDNTPLPNSVELRGLRSPLMGGQLPMNIDGKLNKKQ